MLLTCCIAPETAIEDLINKKQVRFSSYKFTASLLHLSCSKLSYHLAALLNADNFLMDHFILLTHAPLTVVLSIRHDVSDTDIFSESASGKSGFKHLINLFKRAIFDFWEVEVDPKGSDEARRCPNPTLIRRLVGISKNL